MRVRGRMETRRGIPSFKTVNKLISLTNFSQFKISKSTHFKNDHYEAFFVGLEDFG